MGVGIMKCRRGHTLVESLVVVAIIMVMLSVALPHYWSAIRLAKQTAAAEAHHQRTIAHSVDGPDAPGMREDARRAYREMVDAGKFETAITEMLYVVTNDAEFEAYWHTLIDPANTEPLEFRDGELVARDFSGEVFFLKRIRDAQGYPARGEYPVGWDFISTNMAHMTVGGLGATVAYSTHQAYVKYPGAFPVTPVVARLSARFMAEVWPTL